MDAERREIAKEIFDLTDHQLNMFPSDQQEFIIKIAIILKNNLQDKPEILDNIKSELLIAVAKYYAELKDIKE